MLVQTLPCHSEQAPNSTHSIQWPLEDSVAHMHLPEGLFWLKEYGEADVLAPTAVEIPVVAGESPFAG